MPVSRILYSPARTSIIYLRYRLLSTCSTQPSDVSPRRIGRADLNHRFTWAYNPQGLPEGYVSITQLCAFTAHFHPCSP